jgi:hypothetical protein
MKRIKIKNGLKNVKSVTNKRYNEKAKERKQVKRNQ